MTPAVQVRHRDLREGRSSESVVQRYLTFQLEDRRYAIPLAQVAEITHNQALSRMPHTPRSVEGLLDLRGNVVPVINLRTRMGLAPADPRTFENILILALDGHATGLLVDRVESVIASDRVIPSGPLLAGSEGCWATGFVLQQDSVIVVLDARLLTALGSARTVSAANVHPDLDRRLDADLQQLIALAPSRTEADSRRLIPQMEAAISHTEEEMAKVVDRIETMLAQVDHSFRGLSRLKQEAKLGRLPGQEAALAEIERIATQIQDHVFQLLQQIQFQDIARQKLERVLSHVRGLQMIIGSKLRDPGRNPAESV